MPYAADRGNTMRLRKKLFACAIVSLIVALIAQNTLAYFTHTDTATNVVTTGTIRIALNETTDTGEVWQDLVNIVPGTSVSKIVTVTNHALPAYVRIQCVITVRNEDGQLLDAGAIQPDMNTADWSFRDGWWYYNDPLPMGADTEPLFTRVEFPAELDSTYARCTVEIHVLAQAVQCANNGSDVFSAAGWPEP